MATSPTQFIKNVTITNSVAQVGAYETPASSIDKVYEFLFCNTHTAAVGITLYLLPTGETVAAKNKILDSSFYVLQPGETRHFGLEQRLAPGTQIHASATVTAVVSVHCSGDRVTP